jgi:hypothetical protein
MGTVGVLWALASAADSTLQRMCVGSARTPDGARTVAARATDDVRRWMCFEVRGASSGGAPENRFVELSPSDP